MRPFIAGDWSALVVLVLCGCCVLTSVAFLMRASFYRWWLTSLIQLDSRYNAQPVALMYQSSNALYIEAATPNPLPAPQATLMATVIKGLLSQNLPWGLVIAGMGIAAVVELCGVNSLAFAVGAYLPLSTSTPLLAGGFVKWIADKINKSDKEESDIGPGALFSSGLIAGGAIMGIVIAILIGSTYGTDAEGKPRSLLSYLNIGLGESLGGWGDMLGLMAFVLLGLVLLRFATQKEKA